MATGDKLQKLLNTKAEIKNALIEKGITNPGDKFSDYPNLIKSIQGSESGGSDINLSDATATAADILKGKSAYTASGKVEGTIETWDGSFEGNVASSGGDDMLQARVDATNSCKYLLYEYQGANVSFLSRLDTSEVTDMTSMFYNCDNLTTVPLFDTSNVTDMTSMFYSCNNLTDVPLFDTSRVTNMKNMFSFCTKLTTVPAFNASSVTNLSGTFIYCNTLKSILMYGMKVAFDISASTKFEREDLVTILNNLGTVTTATTLTMGSTNLGKLTDADKEIATNKGWTLA